MRPPLFTGAIVLLSIACSNEPPSIAVPPGVPSVRDDRGTSASGSHETSAHGDHTPHHGGTVYMKGDLHFEVVLDGNGAHRVYFSDAARAELPASTASGVWLTISRKSAADEILKATVDDAGESWVAAGTLVKSAGATVRVAFVVNDEPYWIDVPFIDARDAEARTSE